MLLCLRVRASYVLNNREHFGVYHERMQPYTAKLFYIFKQANNFKKNKMLSIFATHLSSQLTPTTHSLP